MAQSFVLEPRQLMAAGPLGINLAGTMGYVDMMKETRAWSPLGASTLATDANGWPLADAQVVVTDSRVNEFFNGPDPNAVQPDIGGTYHLSFTGRATVANNFLNTFIVRNQVYDAATNTTTADLEVFHNTIPLFLIDFRNTVNIASSTGAGVSNVKLIQPGYDANTTQLFTNDMLKGLEPFTTVRYLNTDDANNYPATFDATGKLIPLEWSQRRLPTGSSQTSGPGAPGHSWEYMVALANASDTDMWINIPGPASNDYVTNLANLIKNGSTVNGIFYPGLKSNLKVNLELSNEVWGGIYNSYAYNLAAAREEVAAGNSVLNNDGSIDANVWAQRYYLQRTAELTDLFRNVFGADASYAKVRPVLGWQPGNYGFYTSTFPWFERTYGAPRQYFYGMGYANYLEPRDYSSVDGLFNSLNAALPQQYAVTQNFTTIATYHGLENVAYEGGLFTFAPDIYQGQNALAANRDPRMETFIRDLYSTWYAAGGGLAAVFDGPYGTWGPFNTFATAEQAQVSNLTASPKFRGLVALSQASAQPVTAGTAVASASSTGLSVTADTLGLRFINASAGQVNYWLLNVATAGDYTLSLTTTGAAAGRITVSLSDVADIGTFSLVAGSNDLTTLTLRAGLNTLAITTDNPFNAVSLTLTPESTNDGGGGSDLAFNDPGFESVALNEGYFGFAYQPQPSPWTFNVGAGVSGNGSGFTYDNPNAPQGRQVAFVQQTGSISQNLNLAAGTYKVTFSAAQRARFAQQTVQVLLDDTVVGTFTPGDTSYQALTTSGFAVTAGTHRITFRGTVADQDATAFLDNITLGLDATPPVISPTATLLNSSFEAEVLGSSLSSFRYNPSGSSWTFTGTAGVSGNGSGFTYFNPTAPLGQQVAFLQETGSISQSVNFAAGTYKITFSAAQRAFYARQTFQVLLDDTVVGTFTPGDTSYQALTTSGFAVTAGTHRITFRGTVADQDATAFLDNITLGLDATPPVISPTATLLNSSFEAEVLGSNLSNYRYNPSGSSWTFTGSAGVSGNGSDFTIFNPNAPLGQHVAFVQKTGSISQSVNFAAGTYKIAFLAAQRIYYPSQIYQILIDDVVIGAFSTNGSSTYQSLSTANFTVAAGTHRVTFQGLNSTSDGTVFLDGISIIAQ